VVIGIVGEVHILIEHEDVLDLWWLALGASLDTFPYGPEKVQKSEHVDVVKVNWCDSERKYDGVCTGQNAIFDTFEL